MGTHEFSDRQNELIQFWTHQFKVFCQHGVPVFKQNNWNNQLRKHWNTSCSKWFKQHKSIFCINFFLTQKCLTVELSDYCAVGLSIHTRIYLYAMYTHTCIYSLSHVDCARKSIEINLITKYMLPRLIK